MARRWGQKQPEPEPEKSGRRGGGRKGGRRRGEPDYDPSKNDSNKPENQPQQPTHMTYLTGPGGAQVMFVNCYCTNKGNHSRGEYRPT
jgi:hypothetical protein